MNDKLVSGARWCVEERDTGLPVAQGYAPTSDEAIGETMRYAVQFAQDGPVRFWVRRNRKTVLEGSLEGVSFSVKL